MKKELATSLLAATTLGVATIFAIFFYSPDQAIFPFSAKPISIEGKISLYKAWDTLLGPPSSNLHFLPSSDQESISLARRDASQAFLINPNHPATYLLRGSVEYAAGDSTTGLDLITNAVSIEPDFWPAHMTLGILLAEENMQASAKARLELAARIAPDQWITHLNLGIYYLRSGNLDTATESLITAVKLSPDSSFAHQALGSAYLANGDFAKSIHEYDHAISLDPDQPACLENLAAALILSDDFERAEELLEHLASTSPRDPIVDKLMNANQVIATRDFAVDE